MSDHFVNVMNKNENFSVPVDNNQIKKSYFEKLNPNFNYLYYLNASKVKCMVPLSEDDQFFKIPSAPDNQFYIQENESVNTTVSSSPLSSLPTRKRFGDMLEKVKDALKKNTAQQPNKSKPEVNDDVSPKKMPRTETLGAVSSSSSTTQKPYQKRILKIGWYHKKVSEEDFTKVLSPTNWYLELNGFEDYPLAILLDNIKSYFMDQILTNPMLDYRKKDLLEMLDPENVFHLRKVGAILVDEYRTKSGERCNIWDFLKGIRTPGHYATLYLYSLENCRSKEIKDRQVSEISALILPDNNRNLEDLTLVHEDHSAENFTTSISNPKFEDKVIPSISETNRNLIQNKTVSNEELSSNADHSPIVVVVPSEVPKDKPWERSLSNLFPKYSLGDNFNSTTENISYASTNALTEEKSSKNLEEQILKPKNDIKCLSLNDAKCIKTGSTFALKPASQTDWPVNLPGKFKSKSNANIASDIANSIPSPVYSDISKPSSNSDKENSIINNDQTFKRPANVYSKNKVDPIQQLLKLDLRIPIIEETEIIRSTIELGRGAQGVVYKGTWHNVSVAIKSSAVTRDNKSILKEIKLLESIGHTNIVQILGVYITRQAFNLVIEYFPSFALYDILFNFDRDFFPLSEENKHSIGKQMSIAVTYLHLQLKSPIVHRDIKPSNVLVNRQMNVKLCDLGLSTCKDLHTDLQSSIDNANKRGTLMYLAPEAMLYRRHSTASDIWSLAGTIIELYSEEDVWCAPEDCRGCYLYEFIRNKILSNDLPNDKSLPIALQSQIRPCFSRDPIQRPGISDILKTYNLLSQDEEYVVSPNN